MTIKDRIITFSKTFILFLVLSVLSLIVHYDFFRRFDFKSMIAAQKISNQAIDYLFSILTILGSTEVTFIIVLLIFILLYLRRRNFYLSLFLYILIYPLELLGKLLIFHPKPPVFLNRYVFDFHLP